MASSLLGCQTDAPSTPPSAVESPNWLAIRGNAAVDPLNCTSASQLAVPAEWMLSGLPADAEQWKPCDRLALMDKLGQRLAQEKSGRWGDRMEKLWLNGLLGVVPTDQIAQKLPEWALPAQGDTIWVNQFATTHRKIELSQTSVSAHLESPFPQRIEWKLYLSPEKVQSFTLGVRIPCWSDNLPDPDSSFRYQSKTNRKLVLDVNGQWVYPEIVDGIGYITRKWIAGDEISLSIPTSLRKVRSETQSDQFALQYGPIVFTPQQTGQINGWASDTRFFLNDSSWTVMVPQSDFQAIPLNQLPNTSPWMPILQN
ncbi:beta-L-arabinofuranosidase domain-containing protein [Pontibacter sp. G13]|uniref:beta-L-arabinofuranosidase domain-containing protein n=1 Tax=Pontibacter sp. G13 TaxID=3074898 RepID=UPI002889EB54|nr:beta-L-arabinofuranosidase domain-containing protein [Pontibacter sp. G13]WNJ20187.1 glycoside hydrolase family 127 protein [Pontibacter sp. G13]